MILFGLIVGINGKINMDKLHVRVSVCYTELNIFNLINQQYHVGLRSTFALSHVNPLIWNRLF